MSQSEKVERTKLRKPFQGFTKVARGRYPGGQLSLHACNDALTVGAEMTHRLGELEGDGFEEVAILPKDSEGIALLIDIGYLKSKPLKEISIKGKAFTAFALGS